MKIYLPKVTQMLKFNGDTMRKVIQEALDNKCSLLLVKDSGVYFMSEKGAMGEKRRLNVCYADGCNPEVNTPSHVYDRAHYECGGDDFVERLDPTDALFKTFLRGQRSRMSVEFKGTEIIIRITDK